MTLGPGNHDNHMEFRPALRVPCASESRAFIISVESKVNVAFYADNRGTRGYSDYMMETCAVELAG